MKKFISTVLFLTLCFCVLAQKTEQSGWFVDGYTEETARTYLG